MAIDLDFAWLQPLIVVSAILFVAVFLVVLFIAAASRLNRESDRVSEREGLRILRRGEGEEEEGA